MLKFFRHFSALAIAVTLCVGLAFAEDDEPQGFINPLDQYIFNLASDFSNVVNLATNAPDYWVEGANLLVDWASQFFRGSSSSPDSPTNSGGWWLEPYTLDLYKDNVECRYSRSDYYITNALSGNSPRFIITRFSSNTNTDGCGFYTVNDSTLRLSFYQVGPRASHYNVRCVGLIRNNNDYAITVYSSIDNKAYTVPNNSSIYIDEFRAEDFPPFDGLLDLYEVSFSEKPFTETPAGFDINNIVPMPPVPIPQRSYFNNDNDYNYAMIVYKNFVDFHNNYNVFLPSVPYDELILGQDELEEIPLFAFPVMMLDDLIDTITGKYSPRLYWPINIETDFFSFSHTINFYPPDFFGSLWPFITYVFAFFMFYLVFHHLWDNIVMDTKEVDVND